MGHRKRTWRRRTVTDDEIREALRGHSGNVTKAAAALQVDRRTLGRWIKADPALRPEGARRGGGKRPARTSKDRSPDAWARAVRAAYELTPTEDQLVALAAEALTMAHDKTLKPAARTAAAGRYQQLVKQLDLEDPQDGEIERPKATSPPQLRRVK